MPDEGAGRESGPTDLSELSDVTLLELGKLLERRVLAGAARLDEYGYLVRIQEEQARRQGAKGEQSALEGL